MQSPKTIILWERLEEFFLHPYAVTGVLMAVMVVTVRYFWSGFNSERTVKRWLLECIFFAFLSIASFIGLEDYQGVRPLLPIASALLSTCGFEMVSSLAKLLINKLADKYGLNVCELKKDKKNDDLD